MEYKRVEFNGYILGVALVESGGNISEEEYNEITSVFKKRPIAPSGCGYRLKNDMTWEQYEKPLMSEDDSQEATTEDYQEALAEMGVMLDGN